MSWAVALLQESLAQSLELALVVPLDELGLEDRIELLGANPDFAQFLFQLTHEGTKGFILSLDFLLHEFEDAVVVRSLGGRAVSLGQLG